MGGGGGGEYSYVRVLPDEVLLKSTLMKIKLKRNSSGRMRIYEYSSPPPPINALVTYGPVSKLGTHPDNKLLKQHWYKSVACLLEIVRFK